MNMRAGVGFIQAGNTLEEFWANFSFCGQNDRASVIKLHWKSIKTCLCSTDMGGDWYQKQEHVFLYILNFDAILMYKRKTCSGRKMIHSENKLSSSVIVLLLFQVFFNSFVIFNESK